MRHAKLLLVILAIVAVLGTSIAVTRAWRLRREPHPQDLAAQARAPQSVESESAKKNDTSIKVFKCSALYTRVCQSIVRRDPSGRVPASYEGEVGVLRLFKQLIREHRNSSPGEIDELLAQKIYTKSRVRSLTDLFDDIRETIIDIFQRQKSMSPKDVKVLKDILDQVKLELPPPASVYADEPDLLTLDNAYYYRKDGVQKIRIGGATVFGVTSRYNLVFTLAHELTHAISPCDIKRLNVDIPVYRDFLACAGYTPEKLKLACSGPSELPEIFSDWIATHVVADLILDDQKTLNPKQTRIAVYNSIRDICPDDSEEVDDSNLEKSEIADGLSAIHPSTEFRINGILGKHPAIQTLVGCQVNEKENSYGIPSQCYLR